MRTASWWLVTMVASGAAAEDVDAGMGAVAGGDAGVMQVVGTPRPATVVGFDVAQTPWGPGRKSSGDAFTSTAVALDDGPLRWRAGDVSLALGAQYIARAELRTDQDFAAASPDFAFGIDHRARVSARGSAFGRVGVLLELQDVRGFGSEPSTTAVFPAVGVHQAFVDLKALAGLDLRVGRQELSYGEDRLIGNLDWAQSARAFDGVFARLRLTEGLTVDAFGMLLKPPAFSTDQSGGRFQNSGSYFTGLYGRFRRGKVGVDVYSLGLLEDPSTAATGFRPDHNRLTLGARGVAPVGPVTLLGEGALQLGTSTAKERILAGAFAGRVTFALPTTGFYVFGELAAATGDGTPGDGVESTFHQLFPTGHAHLGYLDYAAWQNVVGARGTVGFKEPWLHVWLDVHHLRAWDPRAAWYTAAGAIFVPADATRSDGVMGTEVDLSLTVPLTPALAAAGAAGVFVPGGMGAVQPSGVGRGSTPSTWGFVSLRTQL